MVAAALVSSCSNTKYLPSGQSLYVGADIKIHSTSKKLTHKKNKELTDELKGLLRPAPNTKTLGMRLKLLSYNIAGTPHGKGLRYFLKYKFGEPPVLASSPAFEKNRAVLQNHLENKGYFHDTVTVDTTSKHRKVTAHYHAEIGSQYIIRNISFPSDSDVLSREIQLATKKSRLKPGDPYDLETIKEERTRIDSRLKQKGFYYFSPDDLIVDVDSTIGHHEVDMKMLIKPETPPPARNIYRINDVIVYADYDINNTDTVTAKKTYPKFEGYTIIDPEKKFRPVIFSRTLVFKPGDVYNRNDHNLSLSRLTTLGVFKFVKARFQPVDTAFDHKLNAYYYLTPTEKKSIRLEVSALSKSDNSTGGQVSLNWRNRNLFRGAELLTASIYGGLEEQVSGLEHVSTRRAGIDVDLFLPRIIAPFKFPTNHSFVPKTKIEAGYELYNKTSDYLLTSFKTSFGYVWKENARKEHQLNIISINYVVPANITDSFQRQIDTNITLRRSIERQFIIGSTYNFNFTTQATPNKNLHNFYFNGNVDLSGNLLGLATGANVSKGREISIFNTPFAQYVKMEADFRHYLRLGKNTQLVSRFDAGFGYAYGNSTDLPFVKSFFAGGTNDLRGFRSRSLGPGSFNGDKLSAGFLPDQPGDVKLEFNTELRAKLFSIVRGAVFVDAGNIWTMKEDTARPGSRFTGQFLKQVAVDAGVGLRFDVSILILRLDVGIPLRRPWLLPGSQWGLDFRDYVINIAIGYPF